MCSAHAIILFRRGQPGYLALLLARKETEFLAPGLREGLRVKKPVSFLFSFAFCFSSFHSYLQGLLRQPFGFFAFLFLGDGLDPCLLYKVTNLPATAQEQPRGATPRPRSGAAAEKSYPTSKVREA